jgi:8-oxo-dGTP pyrophosphatase MutT (NUDIX family)
MRRSVAAAALIRSDENGRTLWLAQWNPRWRGYHLVGGHKRPEETFRECLVREIGEELGLVEDEEFVVAAEPTARLEFTAWSEGAREETSYAMELFAVALRGPAREKIDAHSANRWLDEGEIRRGRAADGKAVSPTMHRLLAEIRPGGLERDS